MPLNDITPDFLRTIPLPYYPPNAAKNDYGKLLVIGGSARLPGAAILAAKAALRCGCGTVRVAAPKSVASLMAIHVPELMAVPLPETEGGTVTEAAYDILEHQFMPCDAVVLGPGLDDGPEVRNLCLRLMAECPLPMLIDATALVALAAQEERNPNLGVVKASRILTPHEGEMKGLVGASVPSEKDYHERAQFAGSWAQWHGATLVLKGRHTFIAAPDGQLRRNTAGTRGMGTAGSGDVLAGAIGSFLAQKMNAFNAGIWGVHTHALAGEHAANTRGDDGMIASDFLDELPFVLRSIRKSEPRK